MIKIQEPIETDLASLADIFNAYRVFYHQDSDISIALQFITERLKQKDSKIFIVKNTMSRIIGFIQLYPTFSSVSAAKAWILNDLFVHQDARRQGVAESLMQKAIEFAQANDAKYLALEMHVDNLKAQQLYIKMGFVEQTQSKFFELSF